MNRLRTGLDRALGALLALLMAGAVGNVVWQVFSRFVLGSPSSFTDELARYLLVWLGLIGAARAAGARRHVAIDLLPRRLSPRVGRVVDAAADLATLAFAATVMTAGGIGLVWLSWDLGQHSAALGLPMGVVYLALPLSGSAMSLYSIAALFGGATAHGPESKKRT